VNVTTGLAARGGSATEARAAEGTTALDDEIGAGGSMPINVVRADARDAAGGTLARLVEPSTLEVGVDAAGRTEERAASCPNGGGDGCAGALTAAETLGAEATAAGPLAVAEEWLDGASQSLSSATGGGALE
jgi:hypothetical protein